MKKMRQIGAILLATVMVFASVLTQADLHSKAAIPVEESKVSLGAYSWGGGSDGVIGIHIANLTELQSTAWYASIVTATNSSWGKLNGTAYVGEEAKSIDVQFPGNGEVFLYYNPAEITESFVIKKDTVFTPMGGSANEGKYTIQFTQDYEINVKDHLIGAPEVPVTYTTLDIQNMSVSSYADQTSANRSYMMFEVTQELLPAGAEWWNNYDSTSAVVLVDGVAHNVVFGGGGAKNILALYLPWDAGEENILADAEEIVIRNGSLMSVGTKGLKFEEDFTLVKKQGSWITKAESESFEETKVSLGAYSWGGGSDGVIGIRIGNEDAVKTAAWYSAISTDVTNSWGKLSGTVMVGSEKKTVDVQFPGNGEVFIYYNPAEITESFVIKKDTVFTPVTGSAYAGNYTVQFTKDYGINVQECLIGEPGIQVKYRNLDVTQFTIHAFGDQPEMNRSYMQFAVTQELLPAGDDWWNNYDSASATVRIDGKEYPVMFGGGGAKNILSMYILWNTGDSAVLQNADTIVIKKGATMNVGLSGLKTTKDLKLNRVETIWVSQYTPKEEEPEKPSNTLKASIQFGQITGQNILGIKASISGDKELLDIYGDWSTAYGSIKLGVYNKAGKIVYTTSSQAIYSISDNIYLSGVDLSLYDAILIEKGTILSPDPTCKSDKPIELTNAFVMKRNAEDEWDVTLEAEKTPDTKPQQTESTDPDTPEEAAEEVEEVISGDEYDGTTLIHRKYAEDAQKTDTQEQPTGASTIMIVTLSILVLLVIAATIILVLYNRKRKGNIS